MAGDGGLSSGDSVVVEAAMAGDHDALVRLLEITQPDIRRFARRQCSTSSDADDAVQEALWLLYRRVGMLRAAGALPAWLLTVVRRACLRLARSALPSGGDALEDDPRMATRPTSDLRLDLAAAIASLPPGYREIVLLRDMQEMTVDEIGTALVLSREAVKGRLHRARVLVREYLLA